jgi:hypothetical protein
VLHACRKESGYEANNAFIRGSIGFWQGNVNCFRDLHKINESLIRVQMWIPCSAFSLHDDITATQYREVLLFYWCLIIPAGLAQSVQWLGRAGRLGNQQYYSLRHRCVQTGFGKHPVGRSVTLTTHLRLVPRLRVCGAKSPLTYTSSLLRALLSTGTSLTFIIIIIISLVKIKSGGGGLAKFRTDNSRNAIRHVNSLDGTPRFCPIQICCVADVRSVCQTQSTDRRTMNCAPRHLEVMKMRYARANVDWRPVINRFLLRVRTLWNRRLLEKLIVAYMADTCPVFHGTVFTGARHWKLTLQ